MDTETARRLAALTADFYRENAASFSATRSQPWEGWERCLADSAEAFDGRCDGTAATRDTQPGATSDSTGEGRDGRTTHRPRILDMACGNLRFERCAAQYFAKRGLPEPEFIAVDSCEPLVESGAGAGNPAVDFRALDITESLIRDTLAAEPTLPPCNIAVCFGFMHHVPGFENRARLLKAMAGLLEPGAVMAVSLWRFMDDPRIAAKARDVTARWTAEHPDACLDEHDYLLGWQDRTDTLRYCHHFTDAEIDALLAEVADEVTLLDRFDADGKSGALNAYIVMRKNR